MRGVAALAALLFACPFLTTGLAAADLVIEVTDLRNSQGTVLVEACTPPTFVTARCPHSGTVPARAGTMTVVIRGVPPGTYAIQAAHDENDNGKVDLGLFGIPLEGFGFGNDARVAFGPPDFLDAAVTVTEPRTTVRLAMRYF